MYYANLNDENICIGISCLSGRLNKPNLIEIDKFDKSLVGKKYKNGVWEEVDPMYFYHPLSEQEAVTLQMQSDLEYLVCLKELGL